MAEEEERKKRKERKKGKRRGRKEEEERRSHKYVRNANKNPQRTALVADTILRHADTSILISPSGLSPRKRRPFVVYPSMKYICVYPRTHPGRGGMIQYDPGRARGFTSVSRGAAGSSRSRITLRNAEWRQRKGNSRMRLSYAWKQYIDGGRIKFTTH